MIKCCKFKCNPFKITKKCSRQQCINKYREYFYERLEVDPGFKRAVHALKGRRLACWSKPLPCHGDVIVEYLENLDGGEQR